MDSKTKKYIAIIGGLVLVASFFYFANTNGVASIPPKTS